MNRFQTVDLSAYEFHDGVLRFLRAEVPWEPSPFALIRYSIEGKEEPLGLRLDMDKRAFLDRPRIPRGDGEVELHLDEVAPVVVDLLSKALASEQRTSAR